MKNKFLGTYLRTIDAVLRLRNKIIRKLIHKPMYSEKYNQSDSQVTFYESAVARIVGNPISFWRFRRIFNYREILEHVTFSQGGEYVRRIHDLNKQDLLSEIYKIDNNRVGRPYRYRYEKYGNLSPTTLRYISVAAEISSLFGNPKKANIVEIGVGYGGQALVLDALFDIGTYTMFDLPDVLRLASKYLSKVGNISKLQLANLDDESGARRWDLAISNYAFSELSLSLQKDYLEKVLLKSHRGYLIMNSGKTDLTGRSAGKLSIDQLLAKIPGSKIADERPLTGSDNYVIYWGSKFE